MKQLRRGVPTRAQNQAWAQAVQYEREQIKELKAVAKYWKTIVVPAIKNT